MGQPVLHAALRAAQCRRARLSRLLAAAGNRRDASRAEIWAQHVADEFMVVGAARRHSKADRKAVLEEQLRTGANSAPAPLVSARLFGFKDAMVMTCEHQPFHGKAGARDPRLRQARRPMADGDQLPDHAAGRGSENDLRSETVMTRRNTPRVSFIGFGEAGQAIASGLRESRHRAHRRLGHPVPGSRRRAAESGRREHRRAAGEFGRRRGAPKPT